MSTQTHDQQKSPLNAAVVSTSAQFQPRPFDNTEISAFAPKANQFQSRPFGVQAKSNSRQQQTPDIQTQLEQAKQFSYDLTNIPVFASGTPSLTPPASITPLVQRKCSKCEQEEQVQTQPSLQRDSEDDRVKATDSQATVNPVPELSGTGEPDDVVVFGNTVNLEGETNATFNSSWKSTNQKTIPGQNCEECSSSDCVNLSGTLVNTFTVSTRVTLPEVPDDLTPCQRKRVRKAIDTILNPHEQQHVRAFRTFNGTTRKAFKLKNICRDSIDSKLQEMHDAERQSRQSAAQAKSDALDPFNVPVDLDCEDK
jgi:hypothetical protein